MLRQDRYLLQTVVIKIGDFIKRGRFIQQLSLPAFQHKLLIQSEFVTASLNKP